MASAFSHAIAALAIGSTLYRKQGFKIAILGMICSAIPDADVISFSLGIPYEHMLGHRGITHSLLFAFVFALCVVMLFFRDTKRGNSIWWRLVLFFFLATASHGVLDAITNGGKGIAFFAPFDNTRYFFPWRPVMISPIGAGKFFSEWGLRVLQSEFFYIWIPSLTIMFLQMVLRKTKTADKKTVN